MKKALSLLILFCSIQFTFSQSPLILEMRQIIDGRESQFTSLKKGLLQENPNGVQIFSSNIEDSILSRSLITHSAAEGETYVITYDVENMETMKLSIFMKIVQQYMDELNSMVKSGKYTYKEYNDNGDSITELTDLNGKSALQYISNAKQHLILVFGV